MALYASTDDVTGPLGSLASRLPAWVDRAVYLGMAHAQVVEALGDTYPQEIPTFEGPGLDVVKYAEAKLAAAEILSAIRVNLPADAQAVPEAMRAEALETLARPIVGYPVDEEVLDDDGDPDTPGIIVSSSPRISSFTPMSAFPDPYEAARLAPGSETSW